MKLFACDRCRKQIEEPNEERREWSCVSVAKITAPLAPFQVLDLCEDCTTGLRHFLATSGDK